MTQIEKQSIMDFSAKRISSEIFFAQHPLFAQADYLRSLLNESFKEQDSETLYLTLLFMFLTTFPEGIEEVLCDLLIENWHQSHEDIVSIFQLNYKYPGCVDNIVKAMGMKLDYLAYNEGESLIVKCAWALGSLKTEYAIQKLKELAESDNAIIANAAHYQLVRLGILSR